MKKPHYFLNFFILSRIFLIQILNGLSDELIYSLISDSIRVERHESIQTRSEYNSYDKAFRRILVLIFSLNSLALILENFILFKKGLS